MASSRLSAKPVSQLDSKWLAKSSALDRRAIGRSRVEAPRWRASVGLFEVDLRQGYPQESGDFYLDVDDRLGLREASFETGVLALELVDAWIHGARFGTATNRLESRLRDLVPLAAPLAEQRRVQPLSTQQRPTWPGDLHRSASRKILALYSAVNRRRFAFSETSDWTSPAGGAATTGPPAALRASSGPVVVGIATSPVIHLSSPPSTPSSRGVPVSRTLAQRGDGLHGGSFLRP